MSAPRRQDDAAPDVAGLRQRLRRVAEDVAARWGYRPLHVPSASAESTLARAAEWGAADAEPAGPLRLVAWGPSAAGGDALRLCLEVTGSASPALEAELIELVRDVLGELGLSPLGARLNAPGDVCCGEDGPCARCLGHLEGLEALLDGRGIAHRRDAALTSATGARSLFALSCPGPGGASLGGGERHDGLPARVGLAPTPAVGAWLDLDVLAGAVLRAGTVEAAELAPRGAALLLVDPEATAAALRIAGRLRARIPVEVDHSGRPLAAQLADADARHARFAILLGEEELAAGVVTVKDLDSGAQRALPEDDLLDLIQAWSAGARPASRP